MSTFPSQTPEYRREYHRHYRAKMSEDQKAAKREKDNARYHRTKERPAVKTYRGAYRQKRAYRFEMLDVLKDQPCLDCGGEFPPECMDFDHVDGTKHQNVSQMMMYSIVRIQAELDKCELVCANCHRTRTKKRAKLEVPIHPSPTPEVSHVADCS